MKKLALIAALWMAFILPASSLPKSTIEDMSCWDIIGNGMYNMPTADVSEYVIAKPSSNKLGFNSDCYLGNLVFSQCWLKPDWSVGKAVDALIRKAVTGKKLPDTPTCGA